MEPDTGRRFTVERRLQAGMTAERRADVRMGNGGNRRPRVVVGGGFAGLSAVRELSGTGVDVLLLDGDLYNTFQPPGPLLWEPLPHHGGSTLRRHRGATRI